LRRKGFRAVSRRADIGVGPIFVQHTRIADRSEGGQVTEKMIVCRTKAAYKLAEGTWVLSVADALKRLAAR